MWLARVGYHTIYQTGTSPAYTYTYIHAPENQQSDENDVM